MPKNTGKKRQAKKVRNNTKKVRCRAAYKCRECRLEDHTWRSCPKNFSSYLSKSNRSKVQQKSIPKGVNVLDWIKSESYKPEEVVKTVEVVPEIDFNSRHDDVMPELEDIVETNAGLDPAP